jgi:hypothetical protein
MILLSENSFLKAKIVFKEIHIQKQKNKISNVGVNAAIFIKE